MRDGTVDTFDADKCAYSSAAMGVCGASRDHHGNGGPILYHAFVPSQKTKATLGDKVEAWAKAWQSFKKPDNCRLLYEVAAALKANDAEIERLRAENDLHRSTREHSVYCQCPECTELRNLLGEPYRR